ncbi:merC mercury resistance family protein (plasmid) [Burkholderia thailandensis 34]|uniref:organomercurial transporter MerC n=1 Tax=Burkholderia thailandensis TaxID=57975 RepID=UPI0005F2769C|nr:organomercurial transporter MerC [Burkholderia thailandensis]AJY27136.1 merC mercury resistance family protein [Burkholderia thailandensis 34]AOJ58538.1 mercury transport protein MerC [Burkholderia thailandensis]KXF59762.1 mercury transport protein MerC [Burkholderia thailandensis]PNE73190.1 mercury transport protein MerC [Burkholderia thailandensis]
MKPIARIADKAGAMGTIVSAMGCAMCFPALASLGAAVGLGFLQQYEGLFISRLLPLFATLALLANALGWLRHRQWYRSLLGMIGPTMVFVGVFWLLGTPWMRPLVYTGIALMIGVSIWDLASPAHRRCGPDGCELPEKRR